MSIKAIFMDMDGTMLRSDNTVSEDLKDRLFELSQGGMKICIATGRTFKASKKYIDLVEVVKEPTIHYNGSLIINPATEEIIYEKGLSVEDVERIIDISREESVHLNLYNNDELYIENESLEGTGYAKKVGISYTVQNFDNFKGKTSTKGLFIGENEKLVQLKEKLEKLLPHLHFVFSHATYLEVLNKGANKGTAVLEMLRRFDISPEETMAFGDQWNDLEMLKTVKYGFLMGNATDDLKAEFPKDRITLSNDEEGILKILERIEKFE